MLLPCCLINTFYSSGKAISSLGRDGKAFALCHPMFSPPRELAGAQAGIAMLRLWQSEVGAYDDVCLVSRYGKQESSRVLLLFYRLHSLLFMCDFDCLKLSSLTS